MAGKKVTISDVATRAGVSTGTVSAVINNRSTVREQTRRRVLVAIDELGYEPLPSARNLGAMQGSGSVLEKGIGLIIKEMDNPFYAEVVVGAQELLAERDILSFVCASSGNYEQEGNLIKALRNRSVDGVVIAPVLDAQADLSHLFLLRRSGYPFVLLEGIQGLQANVVSVDNVKASQVAVTYLIERGHERIVHFSGPRYTQHSRDRVLGVEKAFSQSHLRFSNDVVVPAGSKFRDGYDAAQHFVERNRGNLPTAVTCFNDLVALGVMRALADAGLDVPGDVSVVGFDDIPSAAYLSVPLTTMRVPKREMGRRAVERLLHLLSTQPPPDPEHVLLEAELVERVSVRSR